MKFRLVEDFGGVKDYSFVGKATGYKTLAHFEEGELETSAETPAKALNNLNYTAKKECGLQSASFLRLYGDLIEHHIFYNKIYNVMNSRITDYAPKYSLDGVIKDMFNYYGGKWGVIPNLKLNGYLPKYLWLYKQMEKLGRVSDEDFFSALDQLTKFDDVAFYHSEDGKISNNDCVVINKDNIKYQNELYSYNTTSDRYESTPNLLGDIQFIALEG